MIVLTGTTGHLGSRTLDALLRLNLVPPSQLTISSSNPDKVPQIAKDHNVTIRHGDFTQPATLAASFAGADALFLVSFPSPSLERWEHHRTAIDAAVEAGVRTVVYTSLMFGGETGLDTVAGVQQAHVRTIDYLRTKKDEVGLDYVVVREGIYAESWWLYAGFQPRAGFGGAGDDKADIDFVVPDDGPVAWVGWDDLGEGTARILADYEKYKGQTLRLTGPRATTITGVAELVEEVTGRKVNVKIVGREEARRYHIEEKKSVPAGQAWVVESWSGWHEGIKAGETKVVDPLLEQLLGRTPKGVEELKEVLFKAE